MEDGTLKITDANAHEINNPGNFIYDMGGIAAILARCEQSEKTAKELTDEIKAQKIAKRAEKVNEIEKKYNALIAKGPVVVNEENIRIVLAYLNTQNWGSWDLPKMSISYSANQYSIETSEYPATTIKLDSPIEYEGEMVSMFVINAPRGYLEKYHHI